MGVIIGESVMLSGGGEAATIVVTAPAGSTVTMSRAGKTTTGTEVSGTWTFKAQEYGTYTVTAIKDGQTDTKSILVDAATEYDVTLSYVTDVTVTLTGSGSATYCYATINGTKRYTAGAYTVHPGDTITFGVDGYSSTYYGEVKIDGVQVLKVTTQATRTYDWTVPAGVSNVAITLGVDDGFSRITVTTS